jgi:hypothetical protein
MNPQSSNPAQQFPAQWQQNVGLARQACARVFRDGGTPAEALRVFGLSDADAPRDWAVVVDRIAASLGMQATGRRVA